MATAGHPAELIDTDILIDAARGSTDAIALLEHLEESAIVRISVVSAMEMVVGCRNANELVQVQTFFERVTIVPLTATVSWNALRLVQSYSLSHGLTIPDALIAATAIDHDLTLCSKNVRHFQMIAGLRVNRPY